MSQLAALFVLGCGSDYEPTPEELEAQRKYMEEQAEREKHTIFNIHQFVGLARVEGESGALGVKVLRDKNGVLHFMDTKVWPFHYPFCVSNLDEKRTLQEFNEQVYTGKDRSMMFATIVSYPGQAGTRYYCLELNPADPMTDLAKVDGFFEDVKNNFCCLHGIQLLFHPTSAAQIEAIKGKKLNLGVITSETLYGSIRFKLVQAGTFEHKQVHVFDKKVYKEEELQIWLMQRTADDVVVIPSVPNDIPVVGGVICAEIIPPLCHVALLCQNRMTPCCFVHDAISMVKRGNLLNTVANGLVTKTGFYLDACDKVSKPQSAVAPINVKTIEVPKIQIQKPNTSVTNLIDIHEDKEHAKDIHIVGAKAAQLAKIDAIYSQPIFKGTFVVPFHHYKNHVYKHNEITGAISAKLTRARGNAQFFTDFVRVQNVIQNVKIDDELVTSVIDKIKQHNMTSVIFRSSTNAEDLTGFNGAGLYESVPLHGNNVHDHQKVGEAIKKVWASVWSPKAVKEREHYQMEHEYVNMAILVQPFIDKKMTGVKVHYNGVCITHDVARHKVKHGFVVNCFPGSDLRATNYYKNKTPEQTMLVLGREANSVDLQITTLATGQTSSLITQQDASQMVSVFGSLHSSMLGKPHKLDDTTALDIEFMVVDNEKTSNKRELVVLQARPYTVNVVPMEELEAKLDGFATDHRYISGPNHWVYLLTTEGH